jgi:predicted RNase H-like HicB family nuclease
MKVTARARRSGSWWAIDVPEVDGVFTQAKRLDQVSEEVRDAVATMLDIAPADVEVGDIDIVVGAATDSQALNDLVRQAKAFAEQAERAQREASAAMRIAVAALRTSAGLSVRDAGVMLGLSHQRVAQLEGDATPAARPVKKAAKKKTPVPPKRTPLKAVRNTGGMVARTTSKSGTYHPVRKAAAKTTPAGRPAAASRSTSSTTRKK